jgi:hypothetical protein
VTHALAGTTGQGTFANPVVPGALSADQMTTYNLTGTATAAKMGAVKVTGTLHSVGFVLTGQATGQIALANGKGSVTLQLTGGVQQGFSTLPTTFTYKVVAHTGAFIGLSDTGTLTLTVTPQVFNYIPQAKGTFALTI